MTPSLGNILKDRRRRLAAAIVITFVVLPPSSFATERAAAIVYEFIEPTGAIEAEFAPGAGVNLGYLAITTLDRSRANAVLWRPESRPPLSLPLIVAVHGSGGSLASQTIAPLSRNLARRGAAVLAIDTRQAGARVNTDNFFDVRRDIEAAVYTARALGYRTLVLLGHSLGNIQVQFYAATDWSADIKAVVLTAAFANLPSETRHLLVQDEAAYAQLFEEAIAAVRRGEPEAVLPSEMNWITGRRVPVSAQHFLTYRWEAAGAADGTYWIRRIPHPILIVRDEGDRTAHGWEMSALAAAAGGPGTLAPSVKSVTLANPRGPSRGGHGFMDNREALADAVIAWLVEVGIEGLSAVAATIPAR